MARYAAFLRGINLGNRRIKNDSLRGEFEAMGFDGVATFRASGNVIFDSSEDRDTSALSAHIEAGLEAALGYDVQVFLRSAKEVRAIAGHSPFDSQLVEASTGKLQVALLGDSPAPGVRRRVLALGTDEDRLALRGSQLYWLPSGGISDSDLDLKAIESALGAWTMRTKGTIEQITDRHFAD